MVAMIWALVWVLNGELDHSALYCNNSHSGIIPNEVMPPTNTIGVNIIIRNIFQEESQEEMVSVSYVGKHLEWSQVRENSM